MMAVFKKEILENLRDRRVLLNTLIIGPIAAPLIFALVFSFIARQDIERAEAELELAVVGAEYAPNLVAFLERQGVVIKDAPEHPEQAIRDEDEEVILRIPETFADQWGEGRSARLEILTDMSQRYSGTTRQRVRSLVEAYSRQIGAGRLQIRGIDPEVANPVATQVVDLSTPEARGALLLAFLPYVVMIAVFMGANHMAIDTTAGERERKSLEPLLINPAPRWQIMAGKLAATSTFALASLALTLVALIYAMGLLPVENMAMSLNLTPKVVATIFVLIIPVALLAAALLTILAAFAKSLREAQTYMGLVMLIPGIPSFLVLLNPMRTETWMTFVPLFNQSVLTLALVRGEAISALWMFNAIASTLAVALLLAAVAGTLYNRPRLIFTSE